ncbi:DNA repair protein rad51d [Xenoophorus captivus]|uniref:DNA repair protein rad51d n=1 Tax=Xenoophorus captivus TaxID=1517983 RepID=A0ABV0QZ68_9TELE
MPVVFLCLINEKARSACGGFDVELFINMQESVSPNCQAAALFAIRRVLLAQHTAFPVSGADLYEELLSSTAILSTGNPR